MKVRNFLFLLLTLLLCFTALPKPITAQESGLPEASILVDGQPFKTKYFLQEGHLMVPSLFLKHTGSKVNWNSDFKSAVFTLGDRLYAFPVGKKYTDYYEDGKWKRTPISTSASQISDEVYVPLFDVAKKLGMKISYNAQIGRTAITTGITSLPTLIKQGNTKQKLVALTFDDGPDAHYTPKILDILKKKGVPATFFVVGRQIQAYPNVLKRMVDEGHAIANHTWTHPKLSQVTTSKMVQEIQSTQHEMQRVVGRKPDLFRPPYGLITRSDAMVLNDMGFRIIMWSVDTLDWSGASAEFILERVHRDISPGGIVLQHNIQTNVPGMLDGTVEALPQIIDELHEKGYRFVTVQSLLTQSK
jgi:peptidoglycan/xylan/chitin deacetylase (PgdA/CDA1 family)